MAELKQCEFYLLRYVPDVVKGEFVNVGVVLLETGEDEAAFTDVRFTRDWRRVRCLDPEVDIELLEALEDDLRRMLQSRVAEIINYKGPMSRREWLLRIDAGVVLGRGGDCAGDGGRGGGVSRGRVGSAGEDNTWSQTPERRGRSEWHAGGMRFMRRCAAPSKRRGCGR